MYKVLLSQPPSSEPQPLWKHDESELAAILQALSLEGSAQPTTLEVECLHILCIFKLFFWSTYGPQLPVAHSSIGLTKERALAIDHNKEDSIRLTTFAQDLEDKGWLLFPSLYSCNKKIEICVQDIVALLGYKEGLQRDVLQKIAQFLDRLAWRFILDMQALHHK